MYIFISIHTNTCTHFFSRKLVDNHLPAQCVMWALILASFMKREDLGLYVSFANC